MYQNYSTIDSRNDWTNRHDVTHLNSRWSRGSWQFEFIDTEMITKPGKMSRAQEVRNTVVLLTQ